MATIIRRRFRVALVGARKATYVLTAGDRGKTLTVKVTGKKTGYQTTTVTAPRTAKVRG